MLDRPVTDEPGTVFFYNSGGSFLLNAIVQAATGRSPSDYGRDRLFVPIGVPEPEWRRQLGGIPDGGTGIWLRPQEMARFGLLMLREGRWGDVQVVPEALVRQATTLHVPLPTVAGHGFDPTPDLNGYGYQWWIPSFGGAEALGFGGQIIVVLPEHDLVVAVTGTTPDTGVTTPEHLIRDFIIPAVVSDTPLPEDRAAVDRLARAIDIAANPAPQSVSSLPGIVSTISGVTFAVTTGDGRYSESISLTFGQDASEAVVMLDRPGELMKGGVGLDGIRRRSRTATGEVALRGTWRDDRTFVLDYHLMGEAVDETIEMVSTVTW